MESFDDSIKTRDIFKKLQEKRDVSLLHANVLLGAPLSIIQSLYDLDSPSKLTEKVVIDSIFEGSPGVLTFLAEKYKSNYCSDENQWTKLIKKVKNHEEWEEENDEGEDGICSLYRSRYNRHFQDEGCAIEEFMEVFPELIATDLGNFSPIEVCFLTSHFQQTKHFASKIVATPKTAFELSPWEDCPRGQPFQLDGDCMEALVGIFTKYDEICFDWCGWNKEAMEKFIRLLFKSTTTVKQLYFYCYEQFLESMEHILPSIEEERLTCPLEDITIEFDGSAGEEHEGTCALFPFLQHMPKLQKLSIDSKSQKVVNWAALQHTVAHGELKILRIATSFRSKGGSDPISEAHIIPIFESARCSHSLKEISVFRIDYELQRGRIQSYKALEMCMLDILQQNTVLTSVRIGPGYGQLSQKINYLTYLNRHGRGGIRQETTTLLQFLCVLSHLFEDKQMAMKWSVLYGLLRERPSLWIENTPNDKSTGTETGKRKRCEYNATSVD